MKNLIASFAFMAICCSAPAQTKKADSTKRPAPASTRPSNLNQEKIWPASYSVKNKDTKIIPSHPVAQTRGKL